MPRSRDAIPPTAVPPRIRGSGRLRRVLALIACATIAVAAESTVTYDNGDRIETTVHEGRFPAGEAPGSFRTEVVKRSRATWSWDDEAGEGGGWDSDWIDVESKTTSTTQMDDGATTYKRETLQLGDANRFESVRFSRSAPRPAAGGGWTVIETGRYAVVDRWLGKDTIRQEMESSLT